MRKTNQLTKWPAILVLVGLYTTTSFFQTATAEAQSQCIDLFSGQFKKNKSSFEEAIQAFRQNQSLSTTGLRKEVKYVLSNEDVAILIQGLKLDFGKSMAERDQALAGTRNITQTDYMPVFKYLYNGQKKSAKVRFRKYFSRDEADLQWAHLRVNESLKDRSWLELKIEHPEHVNVVIKPRLLCLDRFQADLKSSKRFFEKSSEIAKSLNELNPNQEALVEDFMQFFKQLHSSRQAPSGFFARTEYERVSHSIKLDRLDLPRNADGSAQKIDVQITLDQDIRLTRLTDGLKVSAYDPSETVVEVKIPLQFAGLTRQDIDRVPGLSRVKEFIDSLSRSHIKTYPENRGKMSKIDKEIADDVGGE